MGFIWLTGAWVLRVKMACFRLLRSFQKRRKGREEMIVREKMDRCLMVNLI